MARAHDVIVVGLGAMGSATARALASRGLRVLAFDADRPPHARGSHHGESRIIRKAYYEHPAYVPLLERAYALWDDLAARSGARLLAQTGGLMIGTDAGELVPGVLASVRAHGLAHERLTASEIMQRYPPFRIDPGMVGVHEADAGILFPETCIRVALEAAAAAGAELRFHEPVHEWTNAPSGVQVTTPQSVYTGSVLVLTAGAGLGALLTELRARLAVERQVVAHFLPVGERASFGPERFPIFCIEEPDRRFYYGFPDLGRGGKFGRHHGGVVGEPTAWAQDATASDIADLREFLARRIPLAGGALAEAVVCRYTNTPDFHFIIDRHPRHDGVVVASACSGHGFKFAPVVGEIVADFACGMTPAFDLSLFRFARFA